MRRLPIYLLLDTSESMAGEALDEACRGIDAMVNHLRGDPQALETAWLSVLTFSNTAKQVVPLTELMDFKLPRLGVRTGTSLGAGLKLLTQCLQREVKKTTTTQKGDYKPLVVLFSDGQPTDSWESPADTIKQQRNPSIANIYAIGCGPDVDAGSLRRVTDIVLLMKDMSPSAWKKVFVWLSASVQSQSQALEGGREGQAINLPSLPDALEVAPQYSAPLDSRPRQVFLHARCGRDGRPYLMRFARRGGADHYVALCSHRVDVVEDARETGGGAAQINTAQLDGCPACPYCENPVACACECGTLFCFSGNPRDPLICPACKSGGKLSQGGGGFDLRQARG